MLLSFAVYALYVRSKILVRIPIEFKTPEMDVWNILADSVDVFTRVDSLKSIPYAIIDADVEKRAREERARLAKKPKIDANEPIENFFNDFHDLNGIYTWYDGLQQTHPQLVNKVVFGKSVQNRDLVAYHITSNSNTPKKQVLFMSLIHSREWLTGPVLAYTVWKMIEENPKVLDTLELVVVPVVNPDGYVYTWTSNRYWRKNLGSNGGVDLNRNFDINWSEKGGASTDPNSDAYKGPSAFSEPETLALKNYYSSLKTVIGAIDYHSFSQLILRPLGTQGTVEHEAIMKGLGDKMAKAIFKVDNKRYQSIRIIDLYKTTGSSIDYFYGQKRKVDGLTVRPYAMAYELRPTENGGDFVVKPNLILPTAREIYASNLEYLKQALTIPLNSTASGFNY